MELASDKIGQLTPASTRSQQFSFPLKAYILWFSSAWVPPTKLADDWVAIGDVALPLNYVWFGLRCGGIHSCPACVIAYVMTHWYGDLLETLGRGIASVEKVGHVCGISYWRARRGMIKLKIASLSSRYLFMRRCASSSLF